MTAPSAAGNGVLNKGTDYADGSSVTSTNINAHVDDAVFNANAIDDSTIGVNGSGKLFLKDNGVTTAKITDSNVTTAKIADSNVTTAKIADNAITNAKVLNSSIPITKLAAIADQTIVGNNDGSASAPEALTASEVIGILGTDLLNPTSVSSSTESITFSNGLILKFGEHTTSGSTSDQTVNFVDYGGNFANECFLFIPILTINSELIIDRNAYVKTVSASSAVFSAGFTTDGRVFKFIALGR